MILFNGRDGSGPCQRMACIRGWTRRHMTTSVLTMSLLLGFMSLTLQETWVMANNVCERFLNGCDTITDTMYVISLQSHDIFRFIYVWQCHGLWGNFYRDLHNFRLRGTVNPDWFSNMPSNAQLIETLWVHFPYLYLCLWIWKYNVS